MTNTFYWADLHFGHKLVAGLRGYETPDDHDRALMYAWEKTVNHGDTVYVLGDICGGSKRAALNALDKISKLPGHKRLIAGNHDLVHPMHRPRLADQAPWWDVFESIMPYEVKKISGRKYLLSHFPYSGDHTDEERYTQYRLPDLGLPLLHGHVHDQWKHRDRMWNVGVDHNPVPVSQQAVTEWLQGEPQ